MLFDYLNETFGIEYLLTGKTNQDALENFFSILRGKGGYNFTPTSHDIGIHFANITSMKILFNSPVSNCVPDECENLQVNWKMFREDYKASVRSHRMGEENIDDRIDDDISSDTYLTELKGNAILYFAGYCAYKTISCKNCIQRLLKVDEESTITPTETFLNEKNYKKDVSNYGALKAPTSEYEEISRIVIQIFEKNYKAECHFSNICQNITEKCMSQIKMLYPSFLTDEECVGHITNLVSFFVRVLTRRNCKWSVINREFEKSQKRPTKAKSQSCTASKKLKILNS